MLHEFERRSTAVKQARLSDGERHWNYLKLCNVVENWITYLDRKHAHVVAFDLPNSLDWVALSLALLETNRTAVPVPSFFSPAQKKHVATSSGAMLYITNAVSFIPEKLDAYRVESFRNLTVQPLKAPSSLVLPDGTAIVTYTSGSTGAPKGACLSRDVLLETANALVTELARFELKRHLCVLPLTLLLENVAGLYANLLNGSEIVIPPSSELGLTGSSSLDVARFVAALNQHRPDSAILVPQLLLALTSAAEWGVELPDSLKFLAVGGAKVSESLLHRAAVANLPVFEGYGLTECGSVIALNTDQRSCAGSVGRLLPHVKAKVENGELIVEHPAMLGYVGASADQACSNPIATGDLVTRDEQNGLRIHGRKKNTFITAYGRNISPEWIESELQSELTIALVAVFGEASDQVAALIVPRDGMLNEDIGSTIENVNQRLPDYARVSKWQCISITQLEQCEGLTANGRLRRHAIETAFAQKIHALLFDTINREAISAT